MLGQVLCLTVIVSASLAAEESDDSGIAILPSPASTEPTLVFAEDALIPGHYYALHWSMRVRGQKPWRFRASFSGIEISYLDGNGLKVGSIARHTSCWQTASWAPAWILFRMPEEASEIRATMRIDSEVPLDGRYRVRDFILEDLDAEPEIGPDAGLLSIQVLDEANQPLRARIAVRDSAGQPYGAPLSYACTMGEHYFYPQDPAVCRLRVPPGDYAIRAIKGFEYAIGESSVRIKTGSRTTAKLVLRRKVDAQSKGWYSGDHHTHLFRHGGSLYPMMNVDDVWNIAKAEGLNFVPFMGQDTVFVGKQGPVETNFIGAITEELTRDYWGHICPVGVTGVPTLPVDGNAWPMNLDYADAIRAAGGAVAYAHPYGPLRPDSVFEALADPGAGLISREFPIQVALGVPCTIDVLAKEDDQGDFSLKLHDYMRLLNLGLRAGVSGSTDFHLEQARQPIGGIRTYVHAEKLDWPAVARAYNEGRTFATNGPLVFFTANGKWPGDTIELNEPSRIDVEVQSLSPWGGTVADVYWNGILLPGSAAVSAETRDDPSLMRASFEAKTSGWLLAIVQGPGAPDVMSRPEGKPMVDGQYAITSPIYVSLKDRPIPPDVESAKYYRDWVDAVGRGVDRVVVESNGTVLPEARKSIHERLDRARAYFDEQAHRK